jgi:hypothetical protein
VSRIVAADYDKNIFINSPFDDLYKVIFEAVVFTVIECGFTPRCALEVSNGAQVRIQKINEIIEGCKFGIHDISRTELDAVHSLPRFNMPLELGLFLGCQRFGGKLHKDKCCIIFDKDPHRYQKFISDIAGQDISSHENDEHNVIHKIRDWLVAHKKGTLLPGGQEIAARYVGFSMILPDICAKLHLRPGSLTFTDLVHTIKLASASVA